MKYIEKTLHNKDKEVIMVDKNLTPKEVEEVAGKRYNKTRKWAGYVAFNSFIVGVVLIIAVLLFAGSSGSTGSTYLWGNHTIVVDSGVVTVDGQVVQRITTSSHHYSGGEKAMIGIGVFLLLALLVYGCNSPRAEEFLQGEDSQ